MIAKKIQQINTFTLFAILFGIMGFCFNCYTYYPGFISPDSLDQYTQAYNHQYTDWHPPIMAAFWSLLLHFHKGGALLFLIQLFVYWLSSVIFFLTALKHFKRWSWLVPLLFLMPYLQNFVGNLWKDIGLAISWLLAIVVMVNANYEKRKLTLFETLLCFVLLCYGCWIRINALPGVLPLLGIWIYMKSDPNENTFKTKQLFRKIFVYGLLVIGIQIFITQVFLKPEKLYPECKLFCHDLSGIYKESGDLMFPSFIKEYDGFEAQYIREHYIYSTFDNIWWNKDHKQLDPFFDEGQMQSLRNCWLKAILKHPLIYLKNRSLGFLQFLRITSSGSKLTISYQYIHPNDFGLHYNSNEAAEAITAYVESQRGMPYMQPWFWLFMNLIILFFAHRRKFGQNNFIILCLAYSSLLYIALEFIVFQADTEFRYFYWNCLAMSLAIILAIVSRTKKLQSTEPVHQA